MFDINALLDPISLNDPTGEDLSFSLEFDRILESRRSDDPTLEQGVWQSDIKSADWPAVRRDCMNLLERRSKDLRLAVWLTEATTRLEGFTGFANGLELTASLCSSYWEAIHPRPLDGDLEERIGNLSWLLSNALTWMRETALVSAAQGQFCLNDFEYAQTHLQDSKRDHSRPTVETLEAARRDTPHEFYRHQIEALAACTTALDALQAAADRHLGMEGPSFSAARDLLIHLQQTTQRFARDAGMLLSEYAEDTTPLPAPDTVPDDATLPSNSTTNSNTQTRGPAGYPSSRQEALQQLRQVADYFRRNEPHSPAAYLADKAARWADMPLHVWLKRVIKDNSTLEQMEEMLDVNELGDAK